MIAPKWGRLEMYPSKSLKPRTILLCLPFLSGASREVMAPPRLITRTSIPCEFVMVKMSTGWPSGVLPKACFSITWDSFERMGSHKGLYSKDKRRCDQSEILRSEKPSACSSALKQFHKRCILAPGLKPKNK